MKRAALALVVALVTLAPLVARSAPADALETECEVAPGQIRFADGVLLDVVPGDAGVDREQGTVGIELVERVSTAETANLTGNALTNVSAAREFVDQLQASEDKPCAKAEAYQGPFTNMPPAAASPFGWGGPIIEPVVSDVVTETAVASETGIEIAHSGSESFVLAYFGAGLVAFGAGALGMRRRIVAQRG